MDTPTGLDALRQLDYTMLLCTEIGPMRAFYADVLGLRIEREVPDRYVELRVGASILGLRLRSRDYDGAPGDGASVHLAFRVPPAAVDVAAAQLQERGVELLEPVHDLPDFGHRVVFVADPEQNVVEIYAEI